MTPTKQARIRPMSERRKAHIAPATPVPEAPQEAAVAGDAMTISIAEFKHRCCVRLSQEQEKPLPDNAAIALWCEAIRLAREHADALVLDALADAASREAALRSRDD